MQEKHTDYYGCIGVLGAHESILRMHSVGVLRAAPCAPTECIRHPTPFPLARRTMYDVQLY